MSTGLNCHFYQMPTGNWYYALQNWDCPVGALDWREYATFYGPFKSDDEANEHLHNYHANPGGYSIIRLGDIVEVPEVVRSGIIDARLK